MIDEEYLHSLPYSDKVEMLRMLRRDVRWEKMLKSEVCRRAEILTACLQDALGWSNINIKSRESHFVWARTILANQLLNEGYTPTEIGETMGKTHAAVYHMRNKMRDVFDLPEAFSDIITQWYKFQQKIRQHDIHQGTDSDPVSLGGEFPGCSQSEMGEESGEDCPPGDL